MTELTVTFEEKKNDFEKVINRFRYIVVLMFFVSAWSAYKSNSPPPVWGTILGANIVFLLSALIWELVLRNPKNTNIVKYLSGTTDIIIVFFVKFGFHFDTANSWAMAVKEPASFDIYFLFIIASGLRFDRNFPIYIGFLSALSYSLLLVMAVSSGWMGFSRDASKFLDPHILRVPTELTKILFLIASSFIVAFMAEYTRKNVARVYSSQKKSHQSLELLQGIFSRAESAFNTLPELLRKMKENSERHEQSVLEIDRYNRADAEGVDELVRDGNHINETAFIQQSLTSNVSEKANSMNERMQSMINDTIEASRKAVSAKKITEASMISLRNTIYVVEQMKKHSEEIQNITQAIHGISGQTNLLSLNASIEAARAGEQGRGFAVVADEISKLADRSLSSSKEIQNIVDATVQNMEESFQLMDRTATELKEVGAAVEENSHFLDSIVENIQEQAKLSDEISFNIKEVATIAENVNRLSEDQKISLVDFHERNQNKVRIMQESLLSAEEIAKISSELHKTAQVLEEILLSKAQFSENESDGQDEEA